MAKVKAPAQLFERVIRCLECGITHAEGSFPAQVLHSDSDEEILEMTVHNPGCLVTHPELDQSRIVLDRPADDEQLRTVYHIRVDLK